MELRVDIRGGGGAGSRSFSLLFDSWISGPPGRRQILEPVRELVEGRAPPVADEQIERAAGPAISVVNAGLDGIDLTASGAFNLEFARHMARTHPRWAQGIKPEQVAREADLPMLRDLRALLEGSGFIETRGGRAYSAEPAPSMLESSLPALLMTLGCEIVWDHGFPTQAAELAAAVLLTGAELDPDRLAQSVHPALREYCSGGPDRELPLEVTRLAVTVWLEMAEAVGALPDRYLGELHAEGAGRPRPVGDVARACLVATLRYRVLRSTVLRE